MGTDSIVERRVFERFMTSSLSASSRTQELVLSRNESRTKLIEWGWGVYLG